MQNRTLSNRRNVLNTIETFFIVGTIRLSAIRRMILSGTVLRFAWRCAQTDFTDITKYSLTLYPAPLQCAPAARIIGEIISSHTIVAPSISET